MGFHEVQFPTNISYGSSGGPAYNTNLIVLDSGSEERVSRWGQARHEYNVIEGVKSHDDLADLIQFFHARLGPANGFRYKDWTDYASTAHGRLHDTSEVVTDTDVIIGTGDGVEVDFQLVKKYTSGGVTRSRTITKPVGGTVVVALDGTPQASGWSVNTATGLITFTSPPGADVVVTAGFQFDVPVRFKEDHLDVAQDNFGWGSSKVELVEILTTGEAADEFFYGGAYEVEMTADTALDSTLGRVWVVTTSTPGLKLGLPAATSDIPGGGPHFYIFNEGSEDVILATHTGTTVCTIAAGSAVEVVLSVDAADARTWYAF